MDYINQNLTKRIMRRVYAIWFGRKIGPVLLLEAPLLIVALWETARAFFVAKIIENFILVLHSPAGILGIFRFVGYALYHAPLMPVVIIGFSSGLFLILAYKLVRNFSQLALVRI